MKKTIIAAVSAVLLAGGGSYVVMQHKPAPAPSHKPTSTVVIPDEQQVQTITTPDDFIPLVSNNVIDSPKGDNGPVDTPPPAETTPAPPVYSPKRPQVVTSTPTDITWSQ